MEITDEDRINFLEDILSHGTYTGKVILRESSTGRGFRLHETSKPNALDTVREAIDSEIIEFKGSLR